MQNTGKKLVHAVILKYFQSLLSKFIEKGLTHFDILLQEQCCND